MTKKTFRIIGMHCTTCAVNIDLDLEEAEGVRSAKTSYAEAKTEVEYDEALISEAEIVRIIAKSGYVATAN